MQQASHTIQLMGTIIKLWIEHEQPEKILAHAETMLIDYERRFSANHPNSELMKINHQAGLSPVEIDQELFQLIKIGKAHSLAAASFLNIAIGPLIQAWRIGFSDAKQPSAETIAHLLKIIDANNISLNESQQTVFLKHSGMAIDLGALAKGYFADRIIDFFKQSGGQAGFIDLGGNVLTFGEAPQHKDGFWRVGIQNPFLPRGNHAVVLKIKNQSVVTSGVYERQAQLNGKTYHHIFDSGTGYPIETALASITVVSQESLEGEIWTTRLFGSQPEQVLATLHPLEGVNGVVMTQAGDLLYNRSLASRLINPT